MPVVMPHLTMSSSETSSYVYFTGGLVGINFNEGWGLIPTKEKGKPHGIGPLTLRELLSLSEEVGVTQVGCNQMTKPTQSAPFQRWFAAGSFAAEQGEGRMVPALGCMHDEDLRATLDQSVFPLLVSAAGMTLREVCNDTLVQLKWGLRNDIPVASELAKADFRETLVKLSLISSTLFDAMSILIASGNKIGSEFQFLDDLIEQPVLSRPMHRLFGNLSRRVHRAADGVGAVRDLLLSMRSSIWTDAFATMCSADTSFGPVRYIEIRLGESDARGQLRPHQFLSDIYQVMSALSYRSAYSANADLDLVTGCAVA